MRWKTQLRVSPQRALPSFVRGQQTALLPLRSPWDASTVVAISSRREGKAGSCSAFRIVPRMDRDIAELIDHCVDRLDRPVDHPLMALQSTRK